MRAPTTALRRRRRLGVTLVETTIGVALTLLVIGTALRLTQSSSDVARSAASHDVAARRCQQVLSAFADALRSGSLATVKQTNGNAFTSGTTAAGLAVQRVAAVTGTNRLGSAVTLRYVPGAGGTDGEVERIQDGVTQIVARGVTNLTVQRTGDAFLVRVNCSGDGRSDLERNVVGTVNVRARNP